MLRTMRRTTTTPQQRTRTNESKWAENGSKSTESNDIESEKQIEMFQVLLVVVLIGNVAAKGLTVQKVAFASRLAGFAGLLGASMTPVAAIEQQYKLPPIDYADKSRCEIKTSSMGQANAARDKLFDLRECDLKGQSGAGKDMSGIIGESADFSGISFKEGQLSKGLLRNSNFKGCDFTNGIVDRATFEGSNLEGAVFANAVLSGTVFNGANLKDTDFTDAYLGPFDLKNLCLNPSLAGKNPTTGVDTRESAGCL